MAVQQTSWSQESYKSHSDPSPNRVGSSRSGLLYSRSSTALINDFIDLQMLSTPCAIFFQVNMNVLPNARSVSRELFPQNAPTSNPAEESPESTSLTDMAAVFGQFVTHDMTLTWHKPSSSNCHDCFNPGTECFGIDVTSDVIFSAIKCIQMKRATRCITAKDNEGEQVNIATTFIDASHIYGNNDDEVRIARAEDLLGELWQAENNLLPPAHDKKPFCRSPNPGAMPCFYTGDFRRNNVSPGKVYYPASCMCLNFQQVLFSLKASV